jgi:hypothetical protein
MWRYEWNAFLGSRPFTAILRTSPSLFVPSFGDKTPFVRSPIMAEILAFSDAPREPGDGFELSVPLPSQHSRRVG